MDFGPAIAVEGQKNARTSPPSHEAFFAFLSPPFSGKFTKSVTTLRKRHRNYSTAGYAAG
jgi:hypothetical protein